MSETLLHLKKDRHTFKLLQNFLLERTAFLVPVRENSTTSNSKTESPKKEKITPESFSHSWLRFLLIEFTSLLADDDRWQQIIKICEKESSIADAVKFHLDEVTAAYLGIISAPDEAQFEKAKRSNNPDEDLLIQKKDKRVLTLITALENFHALITKTSKSEKIDTSELSQIIALHMNSKIILGHLKTQKWAHEFMKEQGFFLSKMSELSFWERLEEKKHFHLPEVLGRLLLVKTFLDLIVEMEKESQEKNIDMTVSSELNQGYLVFQQNILRELTILTTQLQSKINIEISVPR